MCDVTNDMTMTSAKICVAHAHTYRHVVASEEPRWIMGACATVDDRWISPLFKLADDKTNRLVRVTTQGKALVTSALYLKRTSHN